MGVMIFIVICLGVLAYDIIKDPSFQDKLKKVEE